MTKHVLCQELAHVVRYSIDPSSNNQYSVMDSSDIEHADQLVSMNIQLYFFIEMSLDRSRRDPWWMKEECVAA